MTQNSPIPESRLNTPATDRTKADHAGHTDRTDRTSRTDLASAPKTWRAAATGLIVTVVGVLLLNIAPFLDWVTTDDNEAYSDLGDRLGSAGQGDRGR